MTQGRLTERLDADERARKAWSARVTGATWHQAAQVSGFTDKSNCLRAVRAYFGKLPVFDREQERELWRERLEHLWRQTQRDMLAGRPGAVRGGVAVAQRASQMQGLDEPSRSEVSVAVRSDVQILAVIRAGGLPTVEEQQRYGITPAEVNEIRVEAGHPVLALDHAQQEGQTDA